MKASIIIPNFNGEELLRENLPHVVESKDYEKNNITEIIIIDDGSTDGSVEYIRNNFPVVKIVKHKINRGFSAAVNTGARYAKGDLLVLLNNDVRPQKDFLEPSFKHFEDSRIFGVSFHESGYGWAKGVFRDGYIAHEPGIESDTHHNTFWVSGGSGVFRRDIWMKIGGLDEKLFSPAYWEDVDICYKALKRGYGLVWEPEARVIHKHASTISKYPKRRFDLIAERNQLLFIWKNLTSGNLRRKHISGLFKRLAKTPGYIKIVFMALGKLGFVLKARLKETKETKVSDEAIFASFSK